MDKILDILTEIEAEVEWSIYDGNDNEKIMGLIHQAMDIAVRGKAHKWPEEKPEKGGRYLVRLSGTHYTEWCEVVEYKDGDWKTLLECFITHWWNLPEVE